MAQTVAGRGIRVNCVAPGIIKTNFGDAVSLVISYVLLNFKNSMNN